MEEEKSEIWTTELSLWIKQKDEPVCVDHNSDSLLTRKNLRLHPDMCQSRNHELQQLLVHQTKHFGGSSSWKSQTGIISGGNVGLFWFLKDQKHNM